MSAVCPACGVAVVPGYVRCPKCQAPLPAVRLGPPGGPGGTALVGRSGFPYVPVIITVLVIGLLIAILSMRGDDARPRPSGAELTPAPAPAPPRALPTPPPVAGTSTPPRREAAGPDPSAAVGDLDRALKRQRLWGTVGVVGTRVEIRSAACEDPDMAPVLAAAGPELREAGLTGVRCLAQSGAVVFERDL